MQTWARAAAHGCARFVDDGSGDGLDEDALTCGRCVHRGVWRPVRRRIGANSGVESGVWSGGALAPTDNDAEGE